MSANRNKAHINIEFALFVSLCVQKVELDTIFSIVDSVVNTSVHGEFNTLLLERLVESFTDLDVEEGANTVSVLNDGDFRP